LLKLAMISYIHLPDRCYHVIVDAGHTAGDWVTRHLGCGLAIIRTLSSLAALYIHLISSHIICSRLFLSCFFTASSCPAEPVTRLPAMWQRSWDRRSVAHRVLDCKRFLRQGITWYFCTCKHAGCSKQSTVNHSKRKPAVVC
jgi:hypothetical protein